MRKPSLNRVEALWKTHAESTRRRNASAVAWLSVMMQSVCELPLAWMYSTAASRSETTSTVIATAPYSCRSAGHGGKPSPLASARFPAKSSIFAAFRAGKMVEVHALASPGVSAARCFSCTSSVSSALHAAG